MSSDFMAMDCSPLSELKTTLSIQVYVQIAYHIIFIIQCMWSVATKEVSSNFWNFTNFHIPRS